jgi:hypothetical protein
VHSSCLTGDVFGSQRCECGPQLQLAIDTIADDEQGGMVVYMSGHEGRGIGLWAKAATYILQDAGENTYQANRSLGLPDDSRDFSDAASLIRYFYGTGPFRLLTNNPKGPGSGRARPYRRHARKARHRRHRRESRLPRSQENLGTPPRPRRHRLAAVGGITGRLCREFVRA